MNGNKLLQKQAKMTKATMAGTHTNKQKAQLGQNFMMVWLGLCIGLLASSFRYVALPQLTPFTIGLGDAPTKTGVLGNTANEEGFPFFPTEQVHSFVGRPRSDEHPSLQSARLSRSALVNSSNPFLLCTTPKTGCTALQYFTLYVNFDILLDPEQIKNDPGILYREHRDKINLPKVVTPESLPLFTRLDRVIIARNPYVRFFSSYKDWLGRVSTPGGKKVNVSFPEFARFYEARNFSIYHEKTQWDHIDPISTHCNLRDVRYTSVLRLEEQTLWFNDFLRRYSLLEKMNNYTSSGNIVFAPAINSSARVGDFVSEIVGDRPWPGRIFESAHHEGSSTKATDNYSPEIAAIVTKTFYEDFVRFGYPVWDGNPESFRFV